MKKCSKCNTTKSDGDFNKKTFASGNVGLQPYCKECNKAYKRSYYQKHKSTLKDKNRRRFLDNRRQFMADKKSKGCDVCGYDSNSAALHYHHLDPNSKSHNISTMIAEGFSLESIEVEIGKCKLLCANCHAEETWPQWN